MSRDLTRQEECFEFLKRNPYATQFDLYCAGFRMTTVRALIRKKLVERSGIPYGYSITENARHH